MAKAIVVCLRKPRESSVSEWARAFDERLAPDNAPLNSPYIFEADGLFVFVHNPSASVRCHAAGWCLGATTVEHPNIFEPGSPKPEGTYALCRSDEHRVEVLSDYTASHTIWYYHSKDVFIASTSQRLAIGFLGGFQSNPAARRWLLASGTLGPGHAWDQRLSASRPDSTLCLDRKTFQLTINASSHPFRVIPRPKIEYERRLRNAVEGAVSALDINQTEWTLALSGGMDSRSLFYHLRKHTDLQTVTWGLQESSSVATSDAAIAARLALTNKVPHNYFETNVSEVPVAVTMGRYLAAGEGRIDHISAYMDGLALWRQLAENGRDVIRGYDALGSKWPVSSTKQARALSGFRLGTDYTNQLIPSELSVDHGCIPGHLRQDDEETLDDYRDRLWLEFRTPYLTAALDDVKSAYVEICNPLLFKRVVDVVRELPPPLRAHKRLFEKIVREMFPDTPFAKYISTASVEDIVAHSAVREYLADELDNTPARSVLPEDFLAYLVSGLEGSRHQDVRWRRVIAWFDANLPAVLKRLPLLGFAPQTLDIRRLALRASIIVSMHKMLADDAKTSAHRAN